MKRAFDIVLAAAGLVVLSPVLLLVALAIQLADKGPVLFRQERVGRGLKPFRICKFRTMVVDAEERGPGLTVVDDARVTWLGRWLRKSKLDELPQLFNVLKGEMSLVGPRPELPRYVRPFQDDFREILRVRPGITDIASIAYRDESALLADAGGAEDEYVRRILLDKIRLAKNYVDHASLGYDLCLILETLLVLAYPGPVIDWLLVRLGRHYRTLALIVQGALSALAFAGAILLRFDGAPPAPLREQAAVALPALVLIRCLWLGWFRLDRDVWQYVGLRELRGVVTAVALGSATFWLLLQWPATGLAIPGAVVLLDALLCVLLLSFVRVLRRVHREFRNGLRGTRRLLVVGGGDSADRALHELMSHAPFDYRVVGLIVERPGAVGLRIHGVPILGCFEQLEAILPATAPDEILVLGSSIPVSRRSEMIRRCWSSGRPVKVVPDLEDLMARKDVGVVAEDPEANDLLFREPVQVDLEKIGASFRGRVVLVSGGGGSIGSEICRQIAACAPARLVIFEKHEESLYHIDRELRGRHPDLALDPVIGDVRDAARVAEVLASAHPDVVFHAAAYKHVPMMERNPSEAFKTNVLGTKTLAVEAGRAGVGTFVLISTDKAVEPVSVMGASKRMAELVVQGIAPHYRTRYLTVRFGNVLESSGSVIPLFREQIARGGPLTVTHPDVTRWFMTVPEASQLILEAATIGRGGEVFVLDMGKPVRILDLAHGLIRRYGLRPGEDIPIRITGLRPGERLFEKLFNDYEMVWKTVHPRILMAVERNGDGGARRAEELRGLLRVLRSATPDLDVRDLNGIAAKEHAHA